MQCFRYLCRKLAKALCHRDRTYPTSRHPFKTIRETQVAGAQTFGPTLSKLSFYLCRSVGLFIWKCEEFKFYCTSFHPKKNHAGAVDLQLFTNKNIQYSIIIVSGRGAYAGMAKWTGLHPIIRTRYAYVMLGKSLAGLIRTKFEIVNLRALFAKIPHNN